MFGDPSGKRLSIYINTVNLFVVCAIKIYTCNTNVIIAVSADVVTTGRYHFIYTGVK